jgi:vesicular inhibitory amino acid transporter
MIPSCHVKSCADDQLLFYLRLAPKMLGDTNPYTRFIHWIMVIVSVILMIGGTTWAFIPGSGHGGLDDGR